MTRMTLGLSLDERREAATLSLTEEGAQKPTAHIVLEAPEVTQTIETLAAVRAAMADKITDELDPGARLVSAESDPIWRLEIAEDGSHLRLCLRHSGLGWTAWLMPAEEARNLAEAIQNRPHLPR